MKKTLFFINLIGFLLMPASGTQAQQQDVPEPVFLNFSIQPLYVPTYHGRDPFKILDFIKTETQISISDLDYHGIININGTAMALFGWRTDQTKRFTLKQRKLYSDADIPVDGVVGDITNSQVVLIQGDQKIVYPRQ